MKVRLYVAFVVYNNGIDYFDIEIEVNKHIIDI
jgi:hypothetical protein